MEKAKRSSISKLAKKADLVINTNAFYDRSLLESAKNKIYFVYMDIEDGERNARSYCTIHINYYEHGELTNSFDTGFHLYNYFNYNNKDLYDNYDEIQKIYIEENIKVSQLVDYLEKAFNEEAIIVFNHLHERYFIQAFEKTLRAHNVKGKLNVVTSLHILESYLCEHYEHKNDITWLKYYLTDDKITNLYLKDENYVLAVINKYLQFKYHIRNK